MNQKLRVFCWASGCGAAAQLALMGAVCHVLGAVVFGVIGVGVYYYLFSKAFDNAA